MDISKMHQFTKDDRNFKERLQILKEKMISYFNSPELSEGIEIMKLCISLVNDHIEYSSMIRHDKDYGSRPIDEAEVLRFDYDFNEFWKHQLNDERAYRFYCNKWFNIVVMSLRNEGHDLNSIEEAYFSTSGYKKQLSFF